MKTYTTTAQRLIAEKMGHRGQTAALCRDTGLRPVKVRYIAMGNPPRVDEAWAICQALGLPWTAWLPDEPPEQKKPTMHKTVDSLLSEEAAKHATPVDIDDILKDV